VIDRSIESVGKLMFVCVQSTVRERLAFDRTSRCAARERRCMGPVSTSAQLDTQDHIEETTSRVHHVLVQRQRPRHRCRTERRCGRSC